MLMQAAHNALASSLAFALLSSLARSMDGMSMMLTLVAIALPEEPRFRSTFPDCDYVTGGQKNPQNEYQPL